MSQEPKPGLYTRILRFFLRDLYSRSDSMAESIKGLAAAAENTSEHVNSVDRHSCDIERNILKLLEDSNNGHSERAERAERRLDSLEIYREDTRRYREDTVKRMENDDQTTRELAHRIETVENALCEDDRTTKAVKLFNKRTYSQAGEDAIITYAAAMLGIPLSECNYLDLGANRPKEMSNTNFFYEQGARGVLVEANCTLIPALENERRGDVILNRCITDKSGDKVTFNVLNLDGLSKIGDVDEILKANPNARLEKSIEIETISVNDIMEKYFNGKAPVILNLDIEGLETEILNSIDFEKYRPLFMIIEMIPYSTSLTMGIKDNELLECAKSKGYSEYAFTGINSIFVDQRKYRELTGNNI